MDMHFPVDGLSVGRNVFLRSTSHPTIGFTLMSICLLHHIRSFNRDFRLDPLAIMTYGHSLEDGRSPNVGCEVQAGDLLRLGKEFFRQLLEMITIRTGDPPCALFLVPKSVGC